MENANQPNGGTENTPAQENQVAMSQEALNALIDKKYAKGAEAAKAKLFEELGVENLDSLKETLEKQKAADEASKSELEKATESLAAMQQENERLKKEASEAQFNSNINSLAAQHGVTELDYFKMEYSKQSANEEFKVEEFISGLKESKPFVFGQVVTPPKTDNSSNNKGNPDSFSDKVKKAMTRRELDALYDEL